MKIKHGWSDKEFKENTFRFLNFKNNKNYII